MWLRFKPRWAASVLDRVQEHRPINARDKLKVAAAAAAVPIVGFTGAGPAMAGHHAEHTVLTGPAMSAPPFNSVTVRMLDSGRPLEPMTVGARCDEVPASLTAIGTKYQALGGCSSVLGAPTSEEQDTPHGGGRHREFAEGAIYSSPDTGTFEVHGKIYDFWANAGWERSPFGYPISDEHEVPGGRRSDFQFGSIEWNVTSGIKPTLVERQQRVNVLPIQYQVQQTGYWCGPAAARMALSARISPPSQAALAAALGTTQAGTDWIGQITRELNRLLGPVYRTTEMPRDPPTREQHDRLWNDLVRSIDHGYPVVANIVAPPSNHPPGYPNYTIYHYVAVNGYNRDTGQVHIADSANFSGKQQYWLSFDQLATLIPPKGYSAFAP